MKIDYLKLIPARCIQESINKDRLLKLIPARCITEARESMSKDRLLKFIPAKVNRGDSNELL